MTEITQKTSSDLEAQHAQLQKESKGIAAHARVEVGKAIEQQEATKEGIKARAQADIAQQQHDLVVLEQSLRARQSEVLDHTALDDADQDAVETQIAKSIRSLEERSKAVNALQKELADLDTSIETKKQEIEKYEEMLESMTSGREPFEANLTQMKKELKEATKSKRKIERQLKKAISNFKKAQNKETGKVKATMKKGIMHNAFQNFSFVRFFNASLEILKLTFFK